MDTRDLLNIFPPPPPLEGTPIIRRSEGVIFASAIEKVLPEYPALARSHRITGDIKLYILIDTDGRVISAQIISGPPVLQPAALAAINQWQFQPALLNGQPVKMEGIITFKFKL